MHVVYPTNYPCRINESGRVIHCSSCEMVPDLLEEIQRLKTELKESKNDD